METNYKEPSLSRGDQKSFAADSLAMRKDKCEYWCTWQYKITSKTIAIPRTITFIVASETPAADRADAPPMRKECVLIDTSLKQLRKIDASVARVKKDWSNSVNKGPGSDDLTCKYDFKDAIREQ